MENKDNNKYTAFMRISWFIIASILVFILGLGIKEICTVYSDLKEKVASQEKIIENNNKTISKYKKNESELKDTISEYEEQIEFMDKYVAICPLDGSSLYHKYSCKELDTSSFMAYNISQAKVEGYSPCKICEKNNKVKDSKSEIVYVTNTGSKYHTEWCSYLKSSNPITKEKAIEQGYTACSRCNP